jgi:N-acyl-phosphatidylethanolamine-hydrolysing phospholipase D
MNVTYTYISITITLFPYDGKSINDLVKSSTVHVKKWCVPLGMKKWLLDNFGQQANYHQGINEKDIYEMEWWDELAFDKSEPVSNNRNTTVKVTCAPSQHWCCRTPFDRDIRLWCSWAVETISTPESRSSSNRLAFYFAGDTGVPRNGFPLHKQIGTRLGPFDLAALPIGAYLPRDFIGDSHINPMEARQLHLDLHATYSLAIHWGTFALGDEPFYEPPCLLRECFDSSTVDGKDPFFVVRQGGYVLSD